MSLAWATRLVLRLFGPETEDAELSIWCRLPSGRRYAGQWSQGEQHGVGLETLVRDGEELPDVMSVYVRGDLIERHARTER